MMAKSPIFIIYGARHTAGFTEREFQPFQGTDCAQNTFSKKMRVRQINIFNDQVTNWMIKMCEFFSENFRKSAPFTHKIGSIFRRVLESLKLVVVVTHLQEEYRKIS